MSQESRKAWERFLSAMNPSALHPLDQERLYLFIATAHERGETLNISDLRADLAEHNATELVADSVESLLESGPALLTKYDQIRPDPL